MTNAGLPQPNRVPGAHMSLSPCHALQPARMQERGGTRADGMEICQHGPTALRSRHLDAPGLQASPPPGCASPGHTDHPRARAREHRRQQFAERADAWPNWQENGLVFPTRIGTPMEPRQPTAELEPNPHRRRADWHEIPRHETNLCLTPAAPGCSTRHGSGRSSGTATSRSR
jgi:hypothetical protein